MRELEYTMVSTRLQSSSNSSGDAIVISAPEANSAKMAGGVSCATRSTASTINSHLSCHSNNFKNGQPVKPTLNFLDLPTEIVQNIVSYCGYKAVANMRTVIIINIFVRIASMMKLKNFSS